MPSALTMENGGTNGERSDHDRNEHGATVNGTAMTNGGGAPNAKATVTDEQPSRMNDLPKEITHITQGFVPLSLLLTRLSQYSHNALQDKVAELGKMPVPAATVNGNSAHPSSAPDDASADNIRKKASLLHFAQDLHSKWVKALVIAEWSRKADSVSKLIDLKFHIDSQRMAYDAALDNIINVKRDLTYARMPPPDLKTALQVLSTGKAPWLPDLQYIEPPPLTPAEQAKWTNDLNTLLFLRLNLEEYDKIPQYFRDYEISSGRVTFKVPGEFEVDLTIADEDFEKQFWFIDFRFAFSPAASALPDTLRGYLEGCVNEALEKDGLLGCYKFLHEFALTAKIHEIKRQAIQLSKSSWSGTLMIEPLNRALAIQYWTSRTPPNTTKSWILLAIHNRPKYRGEVEPNTTSYLVAKWYRDNKEVTEVEIPLDPLHLSAETLLRRVVGLHIKHILTSIQDKLKAAPRFRNREAGLKLHISESDPATSYVDTQVGFAGRVSLLMEPITGIFAIKPHSKFAINYEHQLNSGRNPAEDGVNCLENVRCAVTEDQINRQGSCMGWQTKKPPVNSEPLKAALRIREWTRTIWLQRDGWGEDWYIAVLLGLGGDQWWVVEANRDDARIKTTHRLPLNKGQPDLSESFWSNLTIFATGIISQAADMAELHSLEIVSRGVKNVDLSLPKDVRLPLICFPLSKLFPSMFVSDGAPSPEESIGESPKSDTLSLSSKQAWARNRLAIQFKGIRPTAKGDESDDPGQRKLVCVSHALIAVQWPSKFTTLKGKIDTDITYDPKAGRFCLRIQHTVGQPILPIVISRLQAIDRFVNFLESIEKAKESVTSESVTLRRVAFTYKQKPRNSPEQKDEQGESAVSAEDNKSWRVLLDLSKDEINIAFERSNPHLRLIDLAKRLVNSDGGIGALMAWLPSSLPVVTAIDQIESGWAELRAKDQGSLDLSIKALDWMSMRYILPGPVGKNGQRGKQKDLRLDVKLKLRRHEPWWHVYRTNEPPAGDSFTVKLKDIWDGKGDGWHGLTTSATGRPDTGIVSLLRTVDEKVKSMASPPAAAPKGKDAKGA